MAINDKHISAAKTALTLLTWARLGKIAVIAFISILLVLLWLARGLIFHTGIDNTVTKVSTMSISPATKGAIDDIVKKTDRIVAIQVVTVNFQKNIRIETYASIDNPTLQLIYDRVNNNKVVEFALFDDTEVNNSRILRLINGEFVCIPYRESTAYKYAPDGERVVSDVCAIGIPPSYGDFSGILIIYVKDKLSKDDIEQMFLLARNLAIRIFEDNRASHEIKR